MIKGKKGTETQMWVPTKLPFWIIFGVILALTAIILVTLLFSSGTDITRIKGNLESYFLVDRFLRSPNCFTFQDKDIGVIYYGVLDYTKFTDASLDNCLHGLHDEDIAFKLSIISVGSKIEDVKRTIKTNNWNDNKPIEKREQTQHIVINNLNKMYNGEMSIEIQNLKE